MYAIRHCLVGCVCMCTTYRIYNVVEVFWIHVGLIREYVLEFRDQLQDCMVGSQEEFLLHG
jgi:hypothetical protein